MTTLINLAADPKELDERYDTLRAILSEMGSVLVAFSGGADSALLLRVAYDVLGARAAGAIAVSETIPSDEVTDAKQLAAEIGVTLHTVYTEEMLNASFRANASNRCYFCKDELFTKLAPLAKSLNLNWLAYGANKDDLGDHRPGAKAAAEWKVRAPLQEAGLSKPEIRALSRRLGLRTWNKPAMACLSSRIPHGTPIDVAAIRRVEEAERCLRSEGFTQLRVRSHDTIARLEVPLEDLPRLLDPELRTRITARLHELGYRFVTLDLDGFRSGSMNPISMASRP
ncbi:MAG: ATP-dependent sacrificial sulfur transferase LarE [Chloroflexota bacterium]